jgi:hypothetical protein
VAVTTYRYLFTNLATQEIIAELPLTGVGFTQQLNQAGTFSGHILLSGLNDNATGVNSSTYNVLNATIPAKTGLYVDRDGVLVWGGVIWGRTYNSQSQTLTIQAREWISYFERRRITETLVYTNTDQLVLAKNLITWAQGQPNGNIGVIYNTDGQTTSGILVDRTYYYYEYKGVFNAIQDLSRQNDGFDFAIDVSYDPTTGLPRKSFNTYYPHTNGTTVPVFLFPAGNVVEYEYPEDGTLAANYIYTLGAGSNEGKLISYAVDTTKYAQGWALLEDVVNYSDITDSNVLSALAQGQVNAYAYPPTTIKLTAPPYVDPVFGTYEIGDDARIIIQDDRFPNGLDAIYRIVGISIQPGEDGPERVTLTLTQGTSA